MTHSGDGSGIEQLVAEARRFEESNDFPKALEAYRRAYLGDSTNLSIRERVAELLARTGDSEGAVRTYRLIAGYYVASGLPFKAMAVCRRILDIEPGHTETLNALAKIYAMRKQEEDSIAADGLPMTSRSSVPGPAVASAPELSKAPPERPTTPRETHLKPSVPGSDAIGTVDVDLVFRELFGTETERANVPVTWTGTGFLQSAQPLPLLSELPEDALASIIKRIETRRFVAGEIVVKEGDPGTCLYIVVSGNFQVLRRREDGFPEVFDAINDGAYFGEMSFLTGGRRIATVQATTQSLVLQINYEHLQALTRDIPTIMQRIHRSHARRLADNLFRASPLLQAFSADGRAFLVRRCTIETAPPQTILLRQGQEGDGLFLLLLGNCAVYLDLQDGTSKDIRMMHEGDLFGEISMLFRRPCTATVRTATSCTLLKLPREAFEEFIASVPESRSVLRDLSEDRIQYTRNLLKFLA